MSTREKEPLLSQEESPGKSVNGDEGLQKPIGLGIQQHPITDEMGIILSIGDQRTWISYKGAKQIVGEVEMLITTGIAVGASMGILAKAKKPKPQSDIYVGG